MNNVYIFASTIQHYNINTNMSNKVRQKRGDSRLMVDISPLQEEISGAILQDQINNGYVVGVKFTNYIREEIIAPWLNFRLELQKMGYTAPMLSELLSQLGSSPDLHRLLSQVKESKLKASFSSSTDAEDDALAEPAGFAQLAEANK